MQIGIGLPSTIPNVHSDLILDWAKQADQGPFSTLAVLDRLVYPNYEPLVTLAAAAAVTQRIRLMTAILIAPLHNTGVLAKQAASIDALSQGRLSLGVAVGGREDDYRAASAPFHTRGNVLDEQLATMKRIWAGQSPSEDIGSVGPTPVSQGGPELLIGGNTPKAIQRLGRWGDGFIGGPTPPMALQGYQLAQEAWRAAGRTGRPRFIATMSYALGPDAAQHASPYLHDYYHFLGPMIDFIIQSIPTTTEAVQAMIHSFAEVQPDELILFPTIASLDQLDRLAEIVSKTN